MAIKTGFWVRVQNNEVTDCWDYHPGEQRLNTEIGWREAVEVIPDIVPGREAITTHTFNINVTPVEITWAKRSLNINERKDVFIAQARMLFNQVVQMEVKKQESFPAMQYNPDTVAAAKVVLEDRLSVIAAATTHEQVDLLS
jgi:hypothetical protein